MGEVRGTESKSPATPAATPTPPKPMNSTRTNWTLPKIASLLNQHHQRATYGAVAGILNVLPRGVMNGRGKSPEYSWIVAASGSDKGRPTGYETHQIHPECLRQIRESHGRVITASDELRQCLHRLDIII